MEHSLCDMDGVIRKLILANMLGLILLSTVGLASTEECPEEWTPYENMCYRHSQDRKSWSGALNECKHDGGTLAAVTNQHIDDNLWRGGGRGYWIGLTSTKNKNDWLWNDGTEFDDDKWASQEPSGGNTCARIKTNDKIADRSCNHGGFYFICQTENNNDSLIYNGGFWFYISNKTANRYDASRFCFERGGYLARKEVFNILDKRKPDRQYWIGLSRRYWTDGSPYLWHNFTQGEGHNDSPGNCYILHFSDKKWTQHICSDNNFYICQQDKLTTTSASTTISTTTNSTMNVTSPQTVKPSTAITPANSITETTSVVAGPITADTSSAIPLTSKELGVGYTQHTPALLYIFIIIWVLIAVLLIIVIVLAVILRRRINTKHSKDRLSMDEDTQQMSECRGTNSPAYSEQTRKSSNDNVKMQPMDKRW